MKSAISKMQLIILTALRMTVGWHFLYEGFDKLFNPDWSSANYLNTSRWIFAPVFRAFAQNSMTLTVIDILNIAGLILIGLALMLGLWTRIACFSGAGLLFIYYLSHPPFIGLDFGLSTEGNYLIINKDIIEMMTLLALAMLPKSHYLGLDRFFNKSILKVIAPKKEQIKTLFSESIIPVNKKRREFIKGLISIPFLGAFTAALFKKNAWESLEEKNLLDAVSSASVKSFDFSSLDDLRGQIPKARILRKYFSRLILGGNLIGGWAHARDLLYVSKLVKAYHHRDKVFETLLLAEKCGINTILTNPLLCGIIQEYWRRNIGKIQFISDCGGDDLLERVQISVDAGAAACYIQGEKSDALVRDGHIDLIGEALNLIRKNDLPAGIGAHYLKTIQACVDYGLTPDFWMKTLHHHQYWSAHPREEHDNIYCRKPEETIAFMNELKQPWIAFKVLAAGAIEPEDGFRYAFDHGADFICVGMYDFQIVDDVNLTLKILNHPAERVLL
ncbi:DoxX family protein [bacterium]|nr:DoxX family protein [bacterium]